MDVGGLVTVGVVNGTFSLQINDDDDLFMFLYLAITRGSNVHSWIVMKDLSHKGCSVRHWQSLTSGLHRECWVSERQRATQKPIRVKVLTDNPSCQRRFLETHLNSSVRLSGQKQGIEKTEGGK